MTANINPGNKFKEFIESAADIIYSVNAKGYFLFANEFAQKNSGYSVEELKNYSFLDLILPEYRKSAISHYYKQVKRKILSTYFEFPFKTKSGEIKWYGQNATLKEKNGEYILNIIARDITLMKTTEASLRESEKKYRELIELAADGIIITDEAGNFKLVNKTALEMLGYSEDEILQLNISDTYDLNGKAKVEENIKKIKVQESFYIERLMKRKDGSSFNAEIKAKLIHYNCILAIVRDISERLKNEEQLRISEEKYRRLFETMTRGVIYQDASGEITSANPAAEEILGLTLDQMLGRKSDDPGWRSIHEDGTDFPGESHPAMIALKTGREVKNVIMGVFNPALEKYRWINKTAIPLFEKGGGKPSQVYATFEDITERKEWEERVNFQAKLLESVGQALIATDLTGKITFWNKAAENLFGWCEEEALGRNVIDITTSDMSREESIGILGKLTRGEKWSGEFILKKKDGTEFSAYVSDSPIYNSKGELIGIIGITTDLTGQKKIQNELLLAKQKAEDLNTLKSHFLANMSHELRTPMIGILGYSEFLKNEIEEPEQKEMASTIYLSGQRLMETLNLILDLSRIEADKLDVNYRIIDIGSICKEVVKGFEAAAKRKKLSLFIDLCSEPLKCRLDERLLRQSIANLINNAIKFTKSGSIVLSACLTEDKTEIEISVEDNGIGIHEKNHKRIFEEFRQASEGLSRDYEGTGLGLSLTKKFVEKMEGNISLISQPGKGSKFIIRFPMDKESLELMEQNKTEKKEIILKEILCIDDDVVSRNVIAKQLEGSYKVDLSGRQEKALKMIQAVQYDAILMDINLGDGISGAELTTQIREIETYKNTPIIAVTAYAMYGDKEAFLKAGCSHYISKPFTKKKLLQLLKSVFES